MNRVIGFLALAPLASLYAMNLEQQIAHTIAGKQKLAVIERILSDEDTKQQAFERIFVSIKPEATALLHARKINPWKGCSEKTAQKVVDGIFASGTAFYVTLAATSEFPLLMMGFAGLCMACLVNIHQKTTETNNKLETYEELEAYFQSARTDGSIKNCR